MRTPTLTPSLRPASLPLLACTLGLSLMLSGCASTGPSPSGAEAAGLIDKTLQAVGLQKPAAVDELGKLPPLPLHTSVTLRVHAGEVLNTDSAGRSLALVARIYKLRNSETFLQTPYESFQVDPIGNKELPFAKDVVEMREVVLTPGQKLEGIEKLGPGVRALAVVALFRAPAEGRWRFVFDSKAAAGSGVTLGAHACALSVAQGQPLETAPELLRVAGVRCRG